MTSHVQHTCTHIWGGAQAEHATLGLLLTVPMKLHTVYIKALQNKDMRGPVQFCVTASCLSLCFCSAQKHTAIRWVVNDSAASRQVRKTSWSQTIQSRLSDCQSRQRQHEYHQFGIAGGPSGSREAKKVLKTSHAVLMNDGLVCSGSSTSRSGGRRLGPSVSGSVPSYRQNHNGKTN